MDCHTFCRLSCISVSALILGLYLHLYAFVAVLSLPQFCRYIIVYFVFTVFVIRIVGWLSILFSMQSHYFFRPMCAYWYFCLMMVPVIIPLFLFYLYQCLFVCVCVFHTFAIVSMLFSFSFSVVRILLKTRKLDNAPN